MARKSEVKLLRSPRTRVFGSHNSAMSADRRLKWLNREMLNEPRTTTSTNKNRKTQASWARIERGCCIGRTVNVKAFSYSRRKLQRKPELVNFPRTGGCIVGA